MIDLSEMQRRLAATPWWAKPRRWVLDDPDLRQAHAARFRYAPGVLDDLQPGGLYLLRGPRRVGKTVEVKRAVRRLIDDGTDPRLILHMAADRLTARDLRTMVEAAAPLTPAGRRTWFVDEITAIEDGWPAEIKWLRDNDARFRGDTVVLTGSSAANLSESVKALAGRRGDVADPDRVLLPMPFRAFVRARAVVKEPPPEDERPPVPLRVLAENDGNALAEAVRDLAPWLPLFVSEWDDYIRVGGFPRIVDCRIRDASDDAFRRDLLDVVHGEALRRAQWSKAQTDAFTRRLAKGLGSIANHSDIATDLAASATLVKRRIDALRDGFVVWPCHREVKLRPHLRAQAKVYFVDPVFCRLTRAPQTGLDPGILSEQQLGVALLRSFAREAPGAFLDFDQVLHHRTPARKEIDFVGPAFGGVAVESKYVSGNRWRRALPTLKASRWRGIVATRDALETGNPDVNAVPTGLLAWLIGG